MIFVHRKKSKMPYRRLFEGCIPRFLDLIPLLLDHKDDSTSSATISSSERNKLVTNFKKEMAMEITAAAEYKRALESQMLMEVEFESVNDYLFLLRAIGEAIAPLGRSAMFYLAAAVSDFYIPTEEMVRYILCCQQ